MQRKTEITPKKMHDFYQNMEESEESIEEKPEEEEVDYVATSL